MSERAGRPRRPVPRRAVVIAVSLVVVVVVVSVTVAVTGGSSDSFPFASLTAPLQPASSSSSSTNDERPVSSANYLEQAVAGIEATSTWWDAKANWFYEQLGSNPTRAQATLWDSNGLFEAVDEIALADPSSANVAAVKRIANQEARFWNPNLKPVPGYSPQVDEHSPSQATWYDDNAWIGNAFLDAYQASNDRAYLTDAERAFNFIAAAGWDAAQGGGMWWSTEHQWLSGEALAASTELAARLYEVTRQPEYLTHAETYLAWANSRLLTKQGVYLPVASTPYPYLIEPDSYVDRSQPSGPQFCLEGEGPCKAGETEVGPCPTGATSCQPGSIVVVHCGTQATTCRPGTTVGNEVRRGAPCASGSGTCTSSQASTAQVHPLPSGPQPAGGSESGSSAAHARSGPAQDAMPHDGEGAMVAAMTALCEGTGERSWCTEADERARAAITWLAPFADGPQYDSVLVRGLLALYATNHDARLYDFAAKLAGLVTKYAEGQPNLYLRGWDGRAVPSAPSGSLQSDSASISVFAALAMVQPPSPSLFRAADGASSGALPTGPA